jgi:hypothetical protein
MKNRSGKTFRRLVLMNEDTYKGALKCLEKEALARTTAQTLWYEKNGTSGDVRRVSVPMEERMSIQRSSSLSDMNDSAAYEASIVSTEPEQVLPTNNGHTSMRAAELPDASATHNVSLRNSSAKPDQEDVEMHFLTSNRKGIPNIHISKYDSLFRKLRLSNDIHVDEKNQVILDGRSAISGSDFHQLMRSMFVTSSISNRAVGRDSFLEALKRVGVRHTDVSSQSAKVALRDTPVQAGRGRFVASAHTYPPGKRIRVLRVYK